MGYTTKEKVLVAIYDEYQKDLPDMGTITAESLGLELEVFAVAIEKLYNEELIRLPRHLTDAVKRGGLGTPALFVNITGAMISPIGIEYVDRKLGVK